MNIRARIARHHPELAAEKHKLFVNSQQQQSAGYKSEDSYQFTYSEVYHHVNRPAIIMS